MPRTRDEVGDGSSSITNLPKEVREDANPKNPLGDRLPWSSLPGNATDMRDRLTASKLVKEDTTKNQTQSKPSVGLHKDAVKNSTKLNDLNAATASDSPPATVAARVKVNVVNVSTSLNTTPSTVGEPLVLSPAMGALVPMQRVMPKSAGVGAGVGTAAQNTTAQSTVSESAVISDAGANKQATGRVKEVRQVAKQKVVASVPVPATANGGTKGGTTPHPRSGKLEDDSGFIDVLPAATPDGSGHKANKDQATAEQMLPPAISDPTSIDTDVNSDVNSAPHQLPSKSSQSSPLVPPTEIATLQRKTPDSVNLAPEPRKPRSPVQT